jgi:hypothetical protein
MLESFLEFKIDSYKKLINANDIDFNEKKKIKEE